MQLFWSNLVTAGLLPARWIELQGHPFVGCFSQIPSPPKYIARKTCLPLCLEVNWKWVRSSTKSFGPSYSFAPYPFPLPPNQSPGSAPWKGMIIQTLFCPARSKVKWKKKGFRKHIALRHPVAKLQTVWSVSWYTPDPSGTAAYLLPTL